MYASLILSGRRNNVRIVLQALDIIRVRSVGLVTVPVQAVPPDQLRADRIAAGYAPQEYVAGILCHVQESRALRGSARHQRLSDGRPRCRIGRRLRASGVQRLNVAEPVSYLP